MSMIQEHFHRLALQLARVAMLLLVVRASGAAAAGAQDRPRSRCAGHGHRRGDSGRRLREQRRTSSRSRGFLSLRRRSATCAGGRRSRSPAGKGCATRPRAARSASRTAARASPRTRTACSSTSGRRARPASRARCCFWIHGGGYTGGSGSTAIYDGTPLAADGAVVVTINYRLNVFGFLAQPGPVGRVAARRIRELWPPGHGGGPRVGPRQHRDVRRRSRPGNDLRRVGRRRRGHVGHAHAAGRGAVPRGHRPRATGSTAGTGRWPRRRAAGRRPRRWACGWPPRLGSREIPTKPWPRCGRRARPTCLAASNADAGSPFLRTGNVWAPNVDGWVIPDDPLAMYRAGRQHAVPLITGLNGNEGSLMTRNMDIPDAAAFEEHVRSVYPELADEMLAHYDASSPDAARAAIDKVIHDLYFAGPVAGTRRGAGRGQRADVAVSLHPRAPDSLGRRPGVASRGGGWSTSSAR